MRGAFLVAALWLASATGAASQDVTLSARDGAVTVSGTLLSYDGEYFRVETAFGPLTLDGTGVRCDGPGCPELVDFVAVLTWAGPADLLDRLVPRWAEAFARAEGYEISSADGAGRVLDLVDAGTGALAAQMILRPMMAGAALDHVARNDVDFALTRTDMTDAQIVSAVAAGFALPDFSRTRRVVALDAVVPVVAPGNPVREVSLDELSRLLSGDITDWSVLGGADMPVVMHLPMTGSALREALDDRVMVGFDRQVMPGRAQHPSPVDAVRRDPFALGIAALSESGGTRPLMLRGPCGFPTGATPDALKTEEYPLTLPVFLHHPPRRLPRLAREFVGFIRSAAAQDAVRAAGFVDLSVDRVPFSAQGNRLSDAILSGADGAGLAEVQRMVADLRDHDRLTMAFRFRDGSSALDSHSQSNVALLADAFERGVYDGHDVIFAGFSDGQGDADANLRLSRQRARAVRDALLAEIPASARDFRDRLLAEGYGEAAPIACDEEEWGSRLNRRVEVWVRQR